MNPDISASVTINSQPKHLWAVLTTPILMQQWMGEPDMEIKVTTDWKVSSPITVTGFHNGLFENKGIILNFDKERKLVYTHLSSISNLADKPENYCRIEFSLVPKNSQTELTVTIHNFPDEIIYKHMELYWKSTIFLIKEMAEAN